MGSEALEVFHRMPPHLINEVTYLCVLNACSHSGFVDKAQAIFDRIEEKSMKIYTAMVRPLLDSTLFDLRTNVSRSIVSVVQLSSIELKPQ